MLKRYVFGPRDDEALVAYAGSGTSSRSWLTADERGSIHAETDISGAATAINKYDAFGIPAPGNASRFQYTGQAWLPDVALYYYKARAYDPVRGRFLECGDTYRFISVRASQSNLIR